MKEDQWKYQECPRCKAKRGGPQGLHSHSETVWCMRCGWARNLDPAKR